MFFGVYQDPGSSIVQIYIYTKIAQKYSYYIYIYIYNEEVEKQREVQCSILLFC